MGTTESESVDVPLGLCDDCTLIIQGVYNGTSLPAYPIGVVVIRVYQNMLTSSCSVLNYYA